MNGISVYLTPSPCEREVFDLYRPSKLSLHDSVETGDALRSSASHGESGGC